MDYTETLFRAWAKKDGFSLFHITGDFGFGAPERLWWFFQGGEILEYLDGVCDEEAISFFAQHHSFTFVDRLLVCQNQI